MIVKKSDAARYAGFELDQLEEMEKQGYVFQDAGSGFARHDFGDKPEPYKLKEVIGQDTGLAKAEISIIVFGKDSLLFRDGTIGGSKNNLFAMIEGDKVPIKLDDKEGIFFEDLERAA